VIKFEKDKIPFGESKEDRLLWCQMYLEREDFTSEIFENLLTKAYNEGVKYGEIHPADDFEGMSHCGLMGEI
jgi:hypothetical protein